MCHCQRTSGLPLRFESSKGDWKKFHLWYVDNAIVAALCFPNLVNPAIEPSQTYPVEILSKNSFAALWVRIKPQKLGLWHWVYGILLSLSPFQWYYMIYINYTYIFDWYQFWFDHFSPCLPPCHINSHVFFSSWSYQSISATKAVGKGRTLLGVLIILSTWFLKWQNLGGLVIMLVKHF